jgi:hypothetical protein
MRGKNSLLDYGSHMTVRLKTLFILWTVRLTCVIIIIRYVDVDIICFSVLLEQGEPHCQINMCYHYYKICRCWYFMFQCATGARRASSSQTIPLNEGRFLLLLSSLRELVTFLYLSVISSGPYLNKDLSCDIPDLDGEFIYRNYDTIM